jgi:hypothetical protein
VDPYIHRLTDEYKSFIFFTTTCFGCLPENRQNIHDISYTVPISHTSSYSYNILLFWHLLYSHFTSRRSPAKVSFTKLFAISNHSAECAPLSLNLSYIVCRSSANFNTVGLLREGNLNLVFTVKVVELNG